MGEHFQRSFSLLNFSFAPDGVSVSVEAVLCSKEVTSGVAPTSGELPQIQSLSKANFSNNPKSAKKPTPNQKLKDHNWLIFRQAWTQLKDPVGADSLILPSVFSPCKLL